MPLRLRTLMIALAQRPFQIPTFTTRGLMAMVAVIAIGIVAAQIGWRAWEYRQRSLMWARFATELRAKLDAPLMPWYQRKEGKWIYAGMRKYQWFANDEARQEAEKLIRYQKAIQNKYAQAARRPWLPVPPDPPQSK